MAAPPTTVPVQSTIRPATLSDAPGIARLHVAVWRETYGHIAPPTAVAALDEAYRLEAWTRALGTANTRSGTLIADAEGELAGFVSFGPAAALALGDAGEIRHLYVARDARGRGLGRDLLVRAFADLSRAGFTTCQLAVVRENAGARRFYSAMDGTEEAAFRDAGPLWRSDNVRVTWSLPRVR